MRRFTIDLPGKRLAGLDHLRALAILLVLFCHYRAYERPSWVDAIGRFGWTGVDLFFVLSGYLIGGQLLKGMARGRQAPLREFYVSRFLRILPAYAVVVALYFTFPVTRERDGIAPLWKFVTFTQNFGLDFGSQGAFSHAWSLCIEEQFYLLLPLIIGALTALKAGRRALWLIIGLFLGGLALRAWSWLHFVKPFYDSNIMEGRFVTYNMWVYYPTYNRLDGLLAGICIAALFSFRPQWRDRVMRYGNWWLVLGLLLLTGAYFLCRDHLTFNASVWGFPLLSLGFGCWVLAALSPGCVLYRVRLRGSAFIATLAYALYLTHKQVFQLVHLLLGKRGIPEGAMFFICVAMAVLGALALHMAVERPFLRWRDRLLKREAGVKAEAVVV